MQAGLSIVVDWLFKYFLYKSNRKYMEVRSSTKYDIILVDMDLYGCNLDRGVV